MITHTKPDRRDWKSILKRPALEAATLEPAVLNILREVMENGDEAVRRFSLAFDKTRMEHFEVSQEEIDEASTLVPDALKKAIQLAAGNISRFHRTPVSSPEVVETMPGIHCWKKQVPIERVGLYIPGGTAPLFSTILMLGIPATLAGCREIILCSPPTPQGKLHPAILYAAKLAGVHRMFKAGGVQAIGAMAYGTVQIPQVLKIFGPGNQYVTCAKQLVQKSGTAIDMPAGPSEVAVYADESSTPAYVAADLLSQAEHGIDSQVLLVCVSPAVAQRVSAEIDRQLEGLERKELASAALRHSKIVIVKDEEQAIELLNEYAPEHLILATDRSGELAEQIFNAGSVFLGHYSPESAGDYASGTNHVLPTNGFARSYSGVSTESFMKTITFQQLSREGLEKIGASVELLARAEGLEAHARAVSLRLNEKG